MAEVQRQLEMVRNQFASQQQNQVPSNVHSAAMIELQLVVEQLRHELAEAQRCCTELQWQVDHAGEVNSSQVSELQQQVSELSARLSAYHDLEQRFRVTRDENRKLFNQVQDLKGAIRVFCRIRPAGRTGDPSSSCTEVGEEGELAVHDPSGNLEPRIYRFDKIFKETSTQEEVYEDTQPLIRSVLDGKKQCLFTRSRKLGCRA
jgi:kinesin family protein C2/C3